MALTYGSLFSGIGGMDLGLDRAGMTCSWQVELDPFCRRVLAKHWPSVRRHDDVKTFPVYGQDWRVDVVAGGFPCQDVSRIGKRAGINGTRSGTVNDMLRIVRQLRPRYVVVENPAGFLDGAMGHVLGSLAKAGYDAEWQCLPAAAFGAPHLRERIFLVAHAVRHRLEESGEGGATPGATERGGRDAARLGAVPVLRGLRLHDPRGAHPRLRVSGCGGLAHEPIPGSEAWATESPVCRVANGLPSGMARRHLTALGNAIVPQVAEFIGRRILAHAASQEVAA
jgi:DNA (cytosine-5)-methyltransferase 1